MEQISVERWLEQQNTNSDVEQYAADTWYVHFITLHHFSLFLSSLLPFISLAIPCRSIRQSQSCVLALVLAL